MSRLTRPFMIGLLAATVWWVSAALNEPQRTLPVTADLRQFSSSRAQLLLGRLLGPQTPHPVSSAADAAVRARVLQEFSNLGIDARPYRTFACVPRHGFALITCATVEDIVAQVLPGTGKAVLMMAHYDSVPSGPGASDNMAGVAAVLEAARALRASGIAPLHPVMALITDGEEAGLIGAYAFLQNADLKARVGAVVNADARGTRGPSMLFQTSRGDARLVDLYVSHVPAPDTSSLYAEIYRRLPNDTDLTPFIQAGFPAFNFAFIGNVRYYHSPLDLQRNLSAASLQMQGDNLLGVALGVAQTPYDALGGSDEIYLSLFNRIVPRVPVHWAVPLSLAVWLTIALSTALASRQIPRAALGRALLMPPLLIAACLAAGFVLEFVARVISGTPDPSYAHPLALRAALACGLWALALGLSRSASALGVAAGVWLWMATLAVCSAALLPGVCPYFLFPALVAAIALLSAAGTAGGWAGAWGRIGLLIAGVSGLIVWSSLMVAGEAVMGLHLHALFTVPAALGLLTVCPFLSAAFQERPASGAGATLSAGAAMLAACVAGLIPAFGAEAPQRLNLIYLQDSHGAQWLADPSPLGEPPAPLPSALMRAAAFKVQHSPYPLPGADRLYVAPAASVSLPTPSATVTLAPTLTGMAALAHSALIQWHGSSEADAMILHVPAAAHLRTVELHGQKLRIAPDWKSEVWLQCDGRDCRDASATLTWDGSDVRLQLAEERYGLPGFAASLQRARTTRAMPSQTGDEVMLIEDLTLNSPAAAMPGR
jgi:hypothetical protein